MASKLVFIGGGALKAPPATQDAFQMLPHVGLTMFSTKVKKFFKGRMMVSGAYYICLQYGSEIFPTVIRGQGVALCEIVGGIAIFISPLVVFLVCTYL